MKPEFLFAKVKAINEQERTVDAVASTDEVDRDEEIILPSAFAKHLDSFKANPVILATHQHRLDNGESPVIGSAIPESITIGQSEVGFTMRFADTPLGENYWKLYSGRHMRAFSIGFIPIKWTEDGEQRDRWGRPLRTYTEIELLEISAVPVPSNRNALARAKGYFDGDEVRDAVTEKFESVFSGKFAELKKTIEEGLDDIKTMIADPDGFAGKLLEPGNNKPDPSVPAGDKIAGYLNRIDNAFNLKG